MCAVTVCLAGVEGRQNTSMCRSGLQEEASAGLSVWKQPNLSLAVLSPPHLSIFACALPGQPSDLLHPSDLEIYTSCGQAQRACGLGMKAWWSIPGTRAPWS